MSTGGAVGGGKAATPPMRVGRYERRTLLGAGGTSEVWLGVAVDSGQEVALKIAVPGREAEAALAHEAAALTCIADDNVAALVEVVALPRGPVLALERLVGVTLAEARERGPIAIGIAFALVAQAARGLAAVHAAVGEDGAPAEIVHRDVSPDNLFVTTNGSVKLFDFNIALVRGRSPALAEAMLGKVGYMAPEQARGEPVDARADVFSLAVVLWELVRGARLFWRGNRLATLRALMDDPIPALDGVPKALAEIVAAALARDREARPSSRQLRDALADVVDDRVAIGAITAIGGRIA